MKKKRLYLVVESERREKNSRIFFAIIAAMNVYSVVISTKAKLYGVLKYLQNGIFIAKSVGPKNLKDFKNIVNSGNYLCSWDEEAINFYDPDHLTNDKIKMDPKCLDLLKYFFLWGKNDFYAIKEKLPKYIDKLVITGNPRIDILKKGISNYYNEKAKKINEKFGEFILVTTKFGRANRKTKGDWVEDYIKAGLIESEKEIKFHKRTVNLENQNLKKYIVTLDKLCKKISSKIIIRPHPNEDLKIYQDYFKDNKQVLIHSDNYSTNSWIVASKFLISFNCVTSIEAKILKKYCINYIPYRDKEYEFEIPKVCSHNIYDEDELINFAIQNENKNLDHLKDEFEKINYYIKNLDKNESSIIDILTKIEKLEFKGLRNKDINSFFIKFKLRIKKHIHTLQGIIRSFYDNDFKKSYEVLKTKRSNLTKKNIIDTFESQKKNIKDSNEVEIKEIFPGVFCFEK